MNGGDEEFDRVMPAVLKAAAEDVRAKSVVDRKRVADFFGLDVEHLPPSDSPGYRRLGFVVAFSMSNRMSADELRACLEPDKYPAFWRR